MLPKGLIGRLSSIGASMEAMKRRDFSVRLDSCGRDELAAIAGKREVASRSAG